MEFVIIGVFIGLVFAVRGGWRATKKVYQGRRKRWHDKNPDAPGFVSAFAALGDLAAMARYGPKHFWHGARAGWQMGWQKAKDRTHQYTPPDDAVEAAEKDDAVNKWFDHMDDEAERRKEQPGGGVQPEPNGSTPGTNTSNNPNSTDNGPEGDMAGAKAVEINTIDDLVKACKTAINDALAEHKDANERLSRANKKITWVQSLIDEMTKKKFPKNQIAIIEGLMAPAKKFKQSANQAVATANDSLATAKAALKVAEQHQAMVGVAAGTPYN